MHRPGGERRQRVALRDADLVLRDHHAPVRGWAAGRRDRGTRSPPGRPSRSRTRSWPAPRSAAAMFGMRCRRQIAVAEAPCTSSAATYGWLRSCQRRAAQHPGHVRHVSDGQRDRRGGQARRRTPPRPARRAGCRGTRTGCPAPAEMTASTGPRRQAAMTASRVPAVMLIDHHRQRAEHRRLRAGQQPRQHVPALVVEAEQVPAGRADPGQRQVGQVRVVRRDQRPEHRGQRGRARSPLPRSCPTGPVDRSSPTTRLRPPRGRLTGAISRPVALTRPSSPARPAGPAPRTARRRSR